MKGNGVTTLAELVDRGVIQLTRGKVISRKDLVRHPGTYPVYSSAKENDGKFGEYGDFMFDEELITWSVDGGGRLFHRPKHRYSVTNVGGILRILNKEVLDYKYLYYVLSLRHSEARFDWVKKAHPSVIRKLYTDIPVIPLPEQRRIVGILDEAFAGIATAKANAEKNLQNARALFESHLNAVFTQRGEGWTSATVGELVEQQLLAKPLDGNHGEIHPKKSDFVASGVPFIMAAHLSKGVVDQENCYFITKKQASSLRKGFANDGDVLLSHKGTIGRVAILKTSHDFVVLTPQVTFYRILDGTVLHNRYLYFFFQSPKFHNEMSRIAGGGSTRAYIGITKQQELRVDYPRLDDQVQIASTLEDLVRETQRLESIYQRKLAALDELKKSLLHQAFSGQL